MKKLRKKQKRLFKIMKTLIIVCIAYLVIYIGASTYIAEASRTAALICAYLSDFLIIANLVVVFVYYSKYGKTNAFLTRTEHEITDCGYYYTQSTPQNADDYTDYLVNRLKNSGFAIQSDVVSDDFVFDFTAMKKKEFFYIIRVEELNKDDVMAYLDTAISDIAIHNLKRAGNGVVVFITDNADEGAVSLSKMITALGKKEQLKIGIAIVEPQNSKCYFLGNMQTKMQQMIVNNIMNCDIPIPENAKFKERLPYQLELEEKMEDFTIKSYLDGSFYIHY